MHTNHIVVDGKNVRDHFGIYNFESIYVRCFVHNLSSLSCCRWSEQSKMWRYIGDGDGDDDDDDDVMVDSVYPSIWMGIPFWY